MSKLDVEISNTTKIDVQLDDLREKLKSDESYNDNILNIVSDLLIKNDDFLKLFHMKLA